MLMGAVLVAVRVVMIMIMAVRVPADAHIAATQSAAAFFAHINESPSLSFCRKQSSPPTAAPNKTQLTPR
ncbi:MAG: hypothetical protein RLY20_3121 [Verrucomicrobiota bacterium]|jgi:hypothetical protein